MPSDEQSLVEEFETLTKKLVILAHKTDVDPEQKNKLGALLLQKKKTARDALEKQLAVAATTIIPASAAAGGDDDEIEEQAEEGGGDEWITTFSDLMSLLLTLFILLFSMANVDIRKFKSVIGSIQSALTDQPATATPSEVSPDAKLDMESFDRVGKEVKGEASAIKSEVGKFIDTNELKEIVAVQEDERGIIITLKDQMAFLPGQAVINPQAVEVISKLRSVLEQFDYNIKIEGHTDDRPISTPQYPSNWELSTARACEILRFFLEHGLPAERLSAEGFAEFRPIGPNDTPENRAKNRRIEIIFTREDIYRRKWLKMNKNKVKTLSKSDQGDAIEQSKLREEAEEALEQKKGDPEKSK